MGCAELHLHLLMVEDTLLLLLGSTQVRAKTVQNQLHLPVRRQFAPVQLPDEFPVRALGLHSPSTEPIDWLHQHDCLELGYCHGGAGVFIVESKVLAFGAGDVSVINDREMHRARSAAGEISSWSFVLLDPGRLLSAAVEERELLQISDLGGPGFRNILRQDEHADVAELVRRIAGEIRGEQPGYRAVVRGLVLALMGILHRIAGEAGAAGGGRPAGAAERVAPALNHLARNYGGPITVPALARMCFTSESNFRRVFKLAVGRSPQEYLNYLRIQMSTALLQGTSLSVLEISQRVGYATLSSFNRHFKRITGCSPRAWRKRLS
jgi:AraC-like DNA-binding protein